MNTSRSSYRKTFGSQTAFSTAGTNQPSINHSHVFSTRSVGLDGAVGALKLNEKELLNGINGRFASYIEKVRFLEEQNGILEKKIKEAKSKREGSLSADKLEKLRLLHEQVNDATLAKQRSEIARDNLRGQASELNWKLNHEAKLRCELDEELSRLRKDVDDATMVRVDLERKIETLREELDYVKKLHDEEIEEIKAQIHNQGSNVEVDGVAPDISELLRQIRAQYEASVMKNRDETEQWYKTKFEELETRAKVTVADLEKVQTEITEYRKQVTQLEMELESLKGTNEYLERNLADVEKRYEIEARRSQDRIARLSAEVETATSEMKRHLAEYKRLMSAKISLEKEIHTYRRLLEGEEKKASNSDSSSDEEEHMHRRKVIVKTIETRDGKVVSSSVTEKEVVQHCTSSENSSSSSSSSDEN